jgi:hypothetical protein
LLRGNDFCAELSEFRQWEAVMRSAILMLIVILAFGTTPAYAQGTWLEKKLINAVCDSKATPLPTLIASPSGLISLIPKKLR